ncbi:hypothetical protein PsAD13_03964 [Pseudovibrio sp. Ad13]|uniref:type III secretion apparatus assembly protein SctX n=1 Tax=unclassified Pseudovibrio TaxID=2627060 RepID=UPI0007AE8637|nr:MULTISPECIES: hypothetical protein [unclassified Pseudovibrio]KZK79799.1 hypothetical protein PsAD46_04244 [Pseudovibrio sp. Ad46]KZK81556.1 hypothetical protein PsAD13_03964 [Pseudovibrio sp. Ad13]KZL02084.1 hypothetical protein PsAD5_00033 [Pseudovibrio sp. Ad5]KZL06639.1 hypothetical protein PsAD26_03896 [Pseudovibrio sp. Ad26]
MRVASITIGVNEVSNWKVEDQVQLPEGKKLAPVFLPEVRPLNEVLYRPTLDERLPSLLLPDLSETDILLPTELSEMRKELQRLFAAAALREQGERQRVLKGVADLLMGDVLLDEDLQAALAMLLQG